MREVRAAGESPAAGRAPTVTLQLPAVRGQQDRPRGAEQAASNLPGPLVQPLHFPGEEWEVGASGPRATASAAPGPEPKAPRPATRAPPQLPSRLASLFVLFLISSRPARAGLLAAGHLQQSRDQPISGRRFRSRRARGGGEAGRRRARAGATLRPRSPASAGRLPAPRPMDLLLCLNRLAVSIIFFFVSLPSTAILGN